MTNLLIGTYRKRKYITACLRSVEQHLSGYDDLIFVDDSGDARHAAWLARHGKVIATGGVGYTRAYDSLCEAAEGQEAFVLEEDFVLTADVSIGELSEHLFHRPYLAQVALLRPASFRAEIEAGGVIEYLMGQKYQFSDVDGLIEHTATFTCNPSLWRGHVFALGWPQGRMSEERKRGQLTELGYRFGYLPGIRCEHRGERTGHGY